MLRPPDLPIAPDPDTEGAVILLVDDDAAIIEGVADLLQLYNYTVLTASNGREALEIMRHQIPDLVISDIMMPEMDGYHFFQAVRSNPLWVSIPFLFLTARGQQSDIRRGQSLGADAYLTKPFEPQDLLIAVQGRLKRVRDIHLAAQADIDRMKNQLITTFSHELRTPLTYIYGYVGLLRDQRGDFDDSTVEQMLTGVQRGAERLVKLVEDLMLMVRIDSGVVEMEIALRREVTPLSIIVDAVVAEHHDLAVQRNVKLEASVPEDIMITCMPYYLQDAISRLVHNAVKFCKQDGGRVRIAARWEGQGLCILIADDGIGIEPPQQPLVFERFLQVNRDQLEQQGIGLGLTIARSLVRLHGGDITLQSEPGQGSLFTISLPGHAG